MADRDHRWILFSVWPINGQFQLSTDQLMKVYLSFHELFHLFFFMIPRKTSQQNFLLSSNDNTHLGFVSEFQSVIFNNICMITCQEHFPTYDEILVNYIGTFTLRDYDSTSICDPPFKTSNLIKITDESSNWQTRSSNTQAQPRSNYDNHHPMDLSDRQDVNANKRGKILYISNLKSNSTPLKPMHLIKFFSNYSGVTSLLFLQNKGSGFLEFKSEAFAKQCSKNLEQHKEHLKITNYFSNHKTLARTSKPGENSKRFNKWHNFENSPPTLYHPFTISKISRYVLAIVEIKLEDFSDKSIMVHIYRLFVRIQKCITEKIKMKEKYETIEIKVFDQSTFGFVLDLTTPAHAIQFVMKFGSEVPKSRKFIARFCPKPNQNN